MHTTRAILLTILTGLALNAAPKLRLSATTVGPISVTQGANPASRFIEAFNAGDGNLSLQYASSAPWVSAFTGAARTCADRPASCLPINFNFNTAGLAAGMQTAVVTVSDPNALDAPQTVTVTVQVGGGVPARVNLFVAPNGSSAEATFSSNSSLFGNATTQSGGAWLSLTLDGTGSFRFVFPHRIRARHLEGMPEGTYNGQIAISGSQVPAENRTVPVTLQVTSQPIAQGPEQVTLRTAENSADVKAAFVPVNTGMGSLAVAGVATSTSSGGDWLTAELAADGNQILVTAKGQGLAPGLYQGSVAVASNAANGTLNVPVRLEVTPQAPPFAFFEGARNTAAGDLELAPGSLAELSGEQFTFEDPAAPEGLPLPTEVNGVRVLVNDVAAPLSLLSAHRIAFQIPMETPPGDAAIAVERQGTRGNRISATVLPRAPRIVRTGVGEGGLILNPDGVQATAETPARLEESITIFCTGLGATDVAVPSGSPAPTEEPYARVSPAPRVEFGSPFTGTTVGDPDFAGLTPGMVGLYSIVVRIPADSPQGDVFLRLIGEGYASNRVILPIR